MVQWWISLVLMILTMVWDVEQAGGNGAAKKAEAMKKIMAHLADPAMPVSLPKWVPNGILEWLLDKLVDLAVNALQGFFGK